MGALTRDINSTPRLTLAVTPNVEEVVCFQYYNFFSSLLLAPYDSSWNSSTPEWIHASSSDSSPSLKGLFRVGIQSGSDFLIASEHYSAMPELPTQTLFYWLLHIIVFLNLLAVGENISSVWHWRWGVESTDPRTSSSQRGWSNLKRYSRRVHYNNKHSLPLPGSPDQGNKVSSHTKTQCDAATATGVCVRVCV